MLKISTRISLTIIFLTIFFLNSSCVKWNPKSARDLPTNSAERAKKNVSEGRGVSIGNIGNIGRGGTNYEFSTSNPLWRAALETIDFIPLSTVDYSGGLIISDWYNDDTSKNDEIKITIRFLSNEIRSNSLNIKVFKRNCVKINACATNLINSPISEELSRVILTKAAQLEKERNIKK